MIAHGLTDVGCIRTNNQDAFFAQTSPMGSLANLFVVADGMGGHLAGEVASSQAVSAFSDYLRSNQHSPDGLLDFLVAAAQAANTHVFQQSLANPEFKGMGTTFTALTTIGERGYVAHVGDSRLYQLREQEFIQITQDHSYVDALVRAGELTPEQAQNHPRKNTLTRALGTETDTKIDGYLVNLKPGDYLLLCSDGLSNMLPDDYIRSAIQASDNVETTVIALVEAANANGGVDNITCILIKIEESDDESDSAKAERNED